MKNFRSLLLLTALSLLLPLGAGAQSICFWTDDADVVPVRIYIDEEYIGDVTAAFSEQPLLDTEGTLSVDTTPERHSLTAVDKYGRVYKGWQGTLTVQEGEIAYQRIRGGQFREVNREDYGFVFLNWVPVFTLPRFNAARALRHVSPREDLGPGIGMAATAVGATAALGVAASRNWDVEDSRFPYFALGVGTEYFSTRRNWRNVVQMKARFGGLGGFSLLADAGVSLFPYTTYTGPVVQTGRTRYDSAFTFSIGAGLDYGGLGFSVRYKPSIGDSSDTFLVGRISYDWWITAGFALNFYAGFGVGGFQSEGGLAGRYDFPFGFGLLFKL